MVGSRSRTWRSKKSYTSNHGDGNLSSHCSGGKRREEELKREGWTRRFTIDEPRLSEAVELYKSLGYEVHLEPASFDEAIEECKTCLLADCSKYKTIYTRKLGSDKKS